MNRDPPVETRRRERGFFVFYFLSQTQGTDAFSRSLSLTGKVFISTPEDTGRGAHTDETSTPLEGPWTPLQQPYSIRRRAGPLKA